MSRRKYKKTKVVIKYFQKKGLNLKKSDFPIFKNHSKLIECLEKNHIIKFEWEIISYSTIYSDNPNEILDFTKNGIDSNLDIKELKLSKSWYCVNCSYLSIYNSKN